MGEDGANLNPTLHPASSLREPIQSQSPPPTLLRVMVTAQHPKMTMNLIVRVWQALMMKPQAAAVVQIKKTQIIVVQMVVV